MTETLRTIEDVVHPNLLLPCPDYAPVVDNLVDSIDALPAVSHDPYIEPAKVQILNHLRHVGLSFNVRSDSQDYVHESVLDGPYPTGPTERITKKARKFLYYLGHENDAPDIETPFFERDAAIEQRITELKQAEVATKKDIVASPLKSYQDYSDRLAKDGFSAAFPEFLPTLELLDIHLLTGPDVKDACSVSPFMALWREDVLKTLTSAQTNGRYHESLFAIEEALELLDVVSRGTKKEAPDLYHSGRYEYYFHYLAYQKDHVIFPTSASLGAGDLIKVRGVPLGFVGVNTQDSWVDGFTQTPYEFFHHDVNHSRRMYQFLVEDAASKGLSVEDYTNTSTAFVAEKIVPLLKNTDNKQSDPALRMLLFEMLHEDALSAAPDVIQRAIFRRALDRTPFEEMNGREVTYLMEEGATTLSYVFRKLGHTFYDKPGSRYAFLGDKEDRSRFAIVEAAATVLQEVCGKVPTEEEMLLLEQLTVTDRGFPAAFFAEVKKDILARAGKDGTDFGFLISEPIGSREAINRIRSAAKGIVHTLFGYSALGYQQPSDMLRHVERDLRKLDPQTTSILIGATSEGIGASYEVAKQLGFHTLGLVSSKSIVYGGEYSPFVDEIVIVEDTSWGGLDTKGEPTPTTQAFVGASDFIASYGGGAITKATLKLARASGLSTQSLYLKPKA